MRTHSKLSLFALLVMLSMLLAACPPAAPAAPAAEAPAAAAPAADAKLYIPVISKGFQHQFWQAVKSGALPNQHGAARCHAYQANLRRSEFSDRGAFGERSAVDHSFAGPRADQCARQLQRHVLPSGDVARRRQLNFLFRFFLGPLLFRRQFRGKQFQFVGRRFRRR